MNIDYFDLNFVEANDKLLVAGYLRINYKQTHIPTVINYTSLAFYSQPCDQFTSYFGPHHVSPDNKTMTGCGYGKYCISSNDATYRKYQWLIKIHKIYPTHECILGITSHRDTNQQWWYHKNDHVIHYNFCNRTKFWRVRREADGEWVDMLCLNFPFNSGDSVLLDLDLNHKTFTLLVNGSLCGQQDIKCDGDIKYYLAVHLFHATDYISIEKFVKLHDNYAPYESLTGKEELPLRAHPNNQVLYFDDLYSYFPAFGDRCWRLTTWDDGVNGKNSLRIIRV